MTKASELRVLDKAIAELGTDSYLGPWLASVRANVDADMRSDFVPMLLPRDAENMAAEIVKAAKDEAASRLLGASMRAKATIDKANDDAAAVRARVVRSLTQAAEAVAEGWR